MTIPWGDLQRANYFTDPCYGIPKKVFIEHNNQFTEYDASYQIKIHTVTQDIQVLNDESILTKLHALQDTIVLKHGDFNEEIPEQKMVIRYLTGKETVLEIGGNIGRNSFIISSLVGNKLVTLESNTDIAQQLIENRDLNQFSFHVECSALSKRKLIQQHWNTIPSDVLFPDYTWVNTITLEELRAKYNMVFDTLVLDCEGAFYYILIDMPEILDTIELIIMENDYYEMYKKEYIDHILKEKRFYVDYAEKGGWGPCEDRFFEVWKKLK
jgi:FkbM family methyltransferase